MKRFALLFGALVLSMPATGCDSGGSGSPTEKSASGPAVGHPNAPSEVKDFEAKREKALADQAAKTAARKAGKPASR